MEYKVIKTEERQSRKRRDEQCSWNAGTPSRTDLQSKLSSSPHGTCQACATPIQFSLSVHGFAPHLSAKLQR